MNKILINFFGISIFLISLNATASFIYLDEVEVTDMSITVNIKGSEFYEGLAVGSFFASWDSNQLD